jgi:ATP-dependent Lon protease
MTLQLDRLDHVGASAFEGFVVRKDLVRRYARSYSVPTYVVEFLLGRYCASTDEAEIKEGLEIVEKQLKDRCVRTGQEEVFKNEAYRKGPE